MDSKDIAVKVGAPVTQEDVDTLIGFAAQLLQSIEQPVKNEFDYSAYADWTEKDLPPFTPQTGKRGPKEKPVRQFLRHFSAVVEYNLSSTHGQIEDRVGYKDSFTLTTGHKLTFEQQFDALNQLGKMTFLITKQFYPELTLDGKKDKSNNLDGDFRAILHPKGNRYDLTERQLEELRKKRRKEKRVDELVATIGRQGLWLREWQDRPNLQIEADYLKKKFPLKP